MEINAVLLATGGLDSTTLAYWLRAKGIHFLPLFIDYGQHCAETELATLRKVLPKEYEPLISKINVGDIYKGSKSRLINEANLWKDEVADDDFYIPYRNLLLLSIGAAFAQSNGYQNLYTAFINSNRAKEVDSSTNFLNELGNMLSDYGSIQTKTPFRNMSKYEVAKLGISLQAPIGLTFSCHASSDIPCGACPNCTERLESLKLLSESK